MIQKAGIPSSLCGLKVGELRSLAIYLLKMPEGDALADEALALVMVESFRKFIKRGKKFL